MKRGAGVGVRAESGRLRVVVGAIAGGREGSLVRGMVAGVAERVAGVGKRGAMLVALAGGAGVL